MFLNTNTEAEESKLKFY